MAFLLEQTYGNWKICVVYFATGIAGNLFSVAVAPCKYAIGASTAGFGLIGVQVGSHSLILCRFFTCRNYILLCRWQKWLLLGI